MPTRISQLAEVDPNRIALSASVCALISNSRLTDNGNGTFTIALSADGRTLSYSVITSRQNLWSIPVPDDGPVSVTEARPVTTGNQAIEGVDLSTDGKWLVFDSDFTFRGLGFATGHVVDESGTGTFGAHLSEGDPLELGTTKAAAQEAYRDSGIGPDDIEVAEVHDCFAVAEVLMYEALGFAGKGKGLELIRSGATALALGWLS